MMLKEQRVCWTPVAEFTAGMGQERKKGKEETIGEGERRLVVEWRRGKGEK
jgi:hypothetical protein